MPAACPSMTMASGVCSCTALRKAIATPVKLTGNKHVMTSTPSTPQAATLPATAHDEFSLYFPKGSKPVKRTLAITVQLNISL